MILPRFIILSSFSFLEFIGNTIKIIYYHIVTSLLCKTLRTNLIFVRQSTVSTLVVCIARKEEQKTSV